MAFYNQRSDPSNFVISWTKDPKSDFAIFSKGYTLAAERLAKMLLEVPRFSDYEAYPVAFLYRHALELSLKHVIYSSVELAAHRYVEDIEDKLHNSHNLRNLARAAHASSTLLFPEDELLQTLLPVIETICSEFSDLDPDSYGYRYPIDTKGDHSTKKDQWVNLESFATHMSAVLEELDIIHFALSGETYIRLFQYLLVCIVPWSILEANVMQSTTGLHERSANPVFQEAFLVFDDPIAFHPTNGVFDAEADGRDGAIDCLFRWGEFPTRRLFLGWDNRDPLAHVALEPQILRATTPGREGLALQSREAFIMHLAVIGDTQETHRTGLIAHQAVVDRLALLLAAAVGLLVLEIGWAVDRALRTIMPNRGDKGTSFVRLAASITDHSAALRAGRSSCWANA